MPAQAEQWKQPHSAAVWQRERTGAAHREVAVVTADGSVGTLFVQQGVWMADNYFFPSLPGRQKVLQAPNYHENLRSFLVQIWFSSNTEHCIISRASWWCADDVLLRNSPIRSKYHTCLVRCIFLMVRQVDAKDKNISYVDRHLVFSATLVCINLYKNGDTLDIF